MRWRRSCAGEKKRPSRVDLRLVPHLPLPLAILRLFPAVAQDGSECYHPRMKSMAYCVYREDEFFVAQCLNVDVSSFGSSREEAIANLKEAVELYFDGESTDAYTPVTDAAVGQELVNA